MSGNSGANGASPQRDRIAFWGRAVGAGLFLLIFLWPNDGSSLPLPAQRVAAVAVFMSTLWLTQALPIAATALLPLALFPLCGIQSAADVSKAYVNQQVFLFLGGFIIALGIERWGLHRRIALHIMRALGTNSSRIVLGVMLATGFLSMWISNSASTLLMLPIAISLATSLREIKLAPAAVSPEVSSTTSGSEPSLAKTPMPARSERDRAIDALLTALLLGVAYSASIGGFTSLVGTPTNLTFAGHWGASFKDVPNAPAISAGQWMVAVAPLGAVMMFIAWRVLVWKLPTIPGTEHGRSFFKDELRRLGAPTRAEYLMLGIFVMTAALWIFRSELKFGETVLFSGWGPWAQKTLGTATMHDSTVAIAMALMMFVLPARTDEFGHREYLMDWHSVERLPWGILLLIGGGFALAGAFDSTGLSNWLGSQMGNLVGGWSPILIVGAVCLLVTFLTELTSNVATVAVLLPVLLDMCRKIDLDPRMMLIPATITASCAFMLPVATPPNAIVFSSGRISISQMARTGVVLNLMGVVLTTLATFTLLGRQFGVTDGKLPAWARETPAASRPEK